jgi:hypothetical protein
MGCMGPCISSNGALCSSPCEVQVRENSSVFLVLLLLGTKIKDKILRGKHKYVCIYRDIS